MLLCTIDTTKCRYINDISKILSINGQIIQMDTYFKPMKSFLWLLHNIIAVPSNFYAV
jgi:hypothetical protein